MKYKNLRWNSRRKAPTIKQLKALEDSREHRLTVNATNPHMIRAHYASRQPGYGADEHNEDDGHE